MLFRSLHRCQADRPGRAAQREHGQPHRGSVGAGGERDDRGRRVVFTIIAALYALFAFKLRAGRNWARIVLTIIAVLDLLGLISRNGNPIGYVGALAAIVGCVLSYLPNSGAYFAAVKASRYRG